uniref:Uncharacterized protein n=1 Tax=Manihot esculenta TaxID=3983 RepID=A0A2C9WK73_MANES
MLITPPHYWVASMSSTMPCLYCLSDMPKCFVLVSLLKPYFSLNFGRL